MLLQSSNQTLEAEKSTLPQQVETSSGRCLLDHFSPSKRQRTTVLGNQIPRPNCMQLCADIYNVISQKRERTSIWKTLDASSCTEDCTLECLAITAAATAAAARHLWECVFPHQETGAEGAKRGERGSRLSQQVTQNYPAPGNWSGFLSHLRPQNWRDSNGTNQRCIGQIEKWLPHEIHSGWSGKKQ